ncbi:MAG: HDIG domain-containing protein [Methanolinea sp.]|jgi:putative nucleotidyltransferase with HDIG domain|nr:HDIG domain-containing protein [Methanolinea sp.]
MNREDARALMTSFLEKESLRNHCLATAAIMKALAIRMGGNPEQWELIGILHDIDYEVVGGDMQRHGNEGSRILLEQGVNEEIAGAVRRHNDLLHGKSDILVDVALQAADNISGIIIASAAVKGGKLSEVTEKTIRKKFKERSFAAGCRRENVEGITRFMDLSEFFSLALGAMQGIRSDLGLS